MNEIREIQVELGKSRRAPKSYVARISAIGGQYGLERDFLRGEYDNGILTIRHEQLTDGVYEIQAGSGDRKYVAIDGGFVYKLGTNRADAEAVFANGVGDRHPVAKLPRAKQPDAVADMRITERAANVIREANTEQAQRSTQLPDYGSAGYSQEENMEFETVALTRRLERAWAKATGLNGATLWEATEQPLVRQEEQQQQAQQAQTDMEALAEWADEALGAAPLLCANEHGVELRYCGIVIDGTPPPHAPAHSWPGYDYTLPTPGYWIGKNDHHVHYPAEEVAAWRDFHGGETIHVKATRQDTRVWVEGEGAEYFGYMPEGFDRLWALTCQAYPNESRLLKKTGSHAARSALPRPHYDSQFWVFLEGDLPRELWLAMTSYLEKND